MSLQKGTGKHTSKSKIDQSENEDADNVTMVVGLQVTQKQLEFD
jgi:hypothetical protein